MSYWQEYVKIGNQSYPRFMGGPLDGITDSPFRTLVREFSTQELLFTEMRHVSCVAHDKSGTKALNFAQLERPLNYQIAANSERSIAEACEKILERGVDCIDLNIGCPARNVVSSGGGSALMADLPRLKLILDCLRANMGNTPFTVKIRAGYKQQNAVEVAQLIQDCGAAALTIHPRLQTQMFAGRPDYALAAQVKKSVSIPVLLSGNVINWTTAKLAYEQTGVDGFLIGRGIWSKPWKLHELAEHAAGRPYTVSMATVMSYAIKHLDRMIEHYGVRGLYCFRKHLPFYLKGLPSASALRQQLVICESAEQVKDTLGQLVG
jgi:tRNA-dihydrouridine synthase B